MNTRLFHFLIYCCCCASWFTAAGPSDKNNESAEFQPEAVETERSIGLLRMQMRSKADSDIEEFKVSVLSQTYKFLDQVFSHEYGVWFDRVGLSIGARNIILDTVHQSYTVVVDIKGTAYFEGKAAPPEEELPKVLEKAFQDYHQLFLDILSDSDNSFLSNVDYALVSVNGNDVVDQSVGSTDEKNGDGGMETWTIGLLCGTAAFLVVIGVCCMWICCVSEQSDEDLYGKQSIAKAVTASTRQSRSSSGSEKQTSADEEDENEMEERMRMELRSITSQDSSKFTFNPYSVTSDNRTFRSYDTTGTGVDVDLESWQRGSVINNNAMVPFGQDISVIEKRRDTTAIIQEADLYLSQTSLQRLDGRNRDQGVLRRTMQLEREAQNVIDDLNSLGEQVQAHRPSH